MPVSLNRGDEWSQMKKVASFLQVNQRPDATLLAMNEKQQAGSCEWLTENPTFQEWIHVNLNDSGDTGSAAGTPEKPKSLVLWLHGRPGTGKSVSAGHIIRHLQSRKLSCSFYFFQHDDRAASNVASLLRSLAFQMAESSAEVRRAIVSMAEDEIHANRDDHRVLWMNLFQDRIFRVGDLGPQYWVIDAVDECSDKSMVPLISMLSKLDSKVPIRVFMTSRPGGEVGKRISAAQLKTPFLEMKTGGDETLKDIEMFLQAWSTRSGDTSYQGLVSEVLAKSNGIFLWASLTTAKLEDIYSVEDGQEVLQQIPPEMDGFYSRIIASVAESPSAELAKCALTWVLCSPRPLHLAELTEAIKNDMGRTLTASARQLETMTGQLIFVDNQSGVHIAHQTTSQFLTQPNDHGLWVDRAAANTHIAEVCLKFLCGPDFSPPRIRKGGTTTSRVADTPTGLAEYAALNFSHHLAHSSPKGDTVLLLLNRFLTSNVLTWIERIASTGSLWPLQQTAQRFKAYLSRRAQHQLPVNIESRTVTSWASDIYHIVSAFHTNLLASPSSIHTLIPHLCPTESIIRKLFTKPSERLHITGELEKDWNDRLACCLFSFHASSVACSSRLLAVGLTGGEIKLYNFGGTGTFNLTGTLKHGGMENGSMWEGRRFPQLAFNRTSSMLASTCPSQLVLWDLGAPGESKVHRRWSKDLDFVACSVAFAPDSGSILLTYPHHTAVFTFSVNDGNMGEPLLDSFPDSESSASYVEDWMPAQLIRLDPENKLAALGY